MKIILEKGTIQAESNSHFGKAWIANVTLGGKFGLNRTFGTKRDVTNSSNKYRDLVLNFFKCEEGEFYEFASQESSSRLVKEYYVIRNGNLLEIRAQDVK